MNDPGEKKYGKLLRMLRQGYMSVCLYKNVHQNRTFYDIVIYRKIRAPSGDCSYKRGANLKPSDLLDLTALLGEVEEYLESLGVEINSTG